MSEILYRMESAMPTDANDDKRTITVSVASETDDVTRYFMVDGEMRAMREVLEMSPEAVDLSRYEAGAPVLFNHDRDKHIGVVERAWVGNDKRLYAEIRFSNSEMGREKYQDAKDGILRGVSPGYSYSDKDVEFTTDAGREVARVKRWTPLELSMATIPADFTVGVGRTMDEPHNQERESITMPEQPEAVDKAAIERGATEKERARLTNLNAIYESVREQGIFDVGAADLQKAIESGMEPDAFGRQCLNAETIKPRNEEPLTPGESRDLKRFSLGRAIQLRAQGKALDGAEREFTDEWAKRYGQENEGSIVIPRPDQIRAMLATDFSAGGSTVPTSLGQLVDKLDDTPVVERAGATVISGVSGNIALPRITGGTTAERTSEGSAPTSSELTTDDIKFSPNAYSVSTDYSKQLLLQSGIAIESYIQNDQGKRISLLKDKDCLIGTGASGQIKGVLAYDSGSGINTVTFGGAPTWAKVVDFEAAIQSDNGDVSTMRWVTTPGVISKWKTTSKVSNDAMFIIGMDGMANGYEILRTNQISGSYANYVVFGAWDQMVIVYYGGREIVVDPYTVSNAGKVRITTLEHADMKLKHPESFAISTDAGNQS